MLDHFFHYSDRPPHNVPRWGVALCVTFTHICSKNLPPNFQGILSDLFPGIQQPTPDYDVFIQAAKEICAEKNLQLTESFTEKLIQTYEMMIVRHGFMMVSRSNQSELVIYIT